ncbi:MAG: nitroreductase family protein [Leptolinea sp.]|nr:nitroreductase family protein [Leptolinea sp.]
MIKELVTRNRSYRRFDQSARIAPETLRELCDLMRLSPSGRNAQPLKYMIVSTEDMCARVFTTLAWAGYLKDWDGPEEGERPAAYVVVLGDTAIASNFGIDAGLSIQSLLLGAAEKSLGGCIIQSVKRDELAKVLDVSAGLEILYVIALGKPVEKVVIEQLPADGDFKYWRDEQHVHHVPKRALKDLIIAEK